MFKHLLASGRALIDQTANELRMLALSMATQSQRPPSRHRHQRRRDWKIGRRWREGISDPTEYAVKRRSHAGSSSTIRKTEKLRRLMLAGRK